jgi:hypothetical protein
LEIRRIRYGPSRDRLGDVVWLDYVAPHKHLDVDVTVTSARTSFSVPAVGASLPLRGKLVLGAQHATLDTDVGTPSSLGTPPSI